VIYLRLGATTATLPLWAVARDVSAAQLGRDDRSWRVLDSWDATRDSAAFTLVLRGTGVTTAVQVPEPPEWAADARNPYGGFRVHRHPILGDVALEFVGTGWGYRTHPDIKAALPTAAVVDDAGQVIWSAEWDPYHTTKARLCYALGVWCGLESRRAQRIAVASRYGAEAGHLVRRTMEVSTPDTLTLHRGDFRPGERGGWIARIGGPIIISAQPPYDGWAEYPARLAASGRAVVLGEPVRVA
jgi:hypothetical protein